MSISTSDAVHPRLQFPHARWQAGFSLIEILLALSLALCLALGVAPLWVSFQSLGAREGDETIWTLQGRVAGARFERDLRLSGLQGCPFATATSVLQASASQVVLLVTTSGSGAPLLVEWEIVNDSLMRRWGPCPATRPSTFSHALYSDNKTMLENVDTARSKFSYVVAGCAAEVPLPAADEPLLDSVTMELSGRQEGAAAGAVMTASGRIGR